LPADAAAAERLADPKLTLQHVISEVRGHRRPAHPAQIFPAIAQRQTLAALRGADSFRAFESRIRIALADLHLL
jgi:hypothetical protein